MSNYEYLFKTPMKMGDVNENVSLAQEILNLKSTGTFDFAMLDEVKKFQTERKLTPDGVVGKITWTELIKKAKIRKISKVQSEQLEPATKTSNTRLGSIWNKYGNLIQLLSNLLDVDKEALLAVIAIESSGNAFSKSGKPIIRFENHIFWKYWGKNNPTQFDNFYMFAKDANGKSRADGKNWLGHWFRSSTTDVWHEMHKTLSEETQQLEWQAFEKARTLDDKTAIYSTSFGLGQVIGFNALQAGYQDVDEFVNDMSSEKLQLISVIEFIKNNKTMLEALRQNDFVSFAKVYNGPGQPAVYGEKIKNVYDEAKKLKL